MSRWHFRCVHARSRDEQSRTVVSPLYNREAIGSLPEYLCDCNDPIAGIILRLSQKAAGGEERRGAQEQGYDMWCNSSLRQLDRDAPLGGMELARNDGVLFL
jgi:hypothetical protein